MVMRVCVVVMVIMVGVASHMIVVFMVVMFFMRVMMTVVMMFMMGMWGYCMRYEVKKGVSQKATTCKA